MRGAMHLPRWTNELATRDRAAESAPGKGDLSQILFLLRSAQAAQARHQRARNSPLPPGRSESVVREFLRSVAPG